MYFLLVVEIAIKYELFHQDYSFNLLLVMYSLGKRRNVLDTFKKIGMVLILWYDMDLVFLWHLNALLYNWFGKVYCIHYLCFIINSRMSFGLIPTGPFLKPTREQTRQFYHTILTWGEVDPLQSPQFWSMVRSYG